VPAAPPTATLRAAARATRQAAEEALLRDLVPPPLTDAAIAALATRLGASADATETVRELAARYRQRVDADHARAGAAVRARLANAYASTPAGALEPAPGPELVTVLEQGAAWRATLAAADADLLKQLLVVRTDAAQVSPPLLAFERTVERDDAPTQDPVAGIRLPALLDGAGLEPADRRRVEDALERAWTRMGAAIAARRQARQRVDLERARLVAQWGPVWELTATPAQAAERRARLAELDARDRAGEEELRTAVRDAVMQAMRQSPPDAAARIRDQVDALAWPALFVQEDLLAQAVSAAAQGTEPALAEALRTVLAEVQRKLEPTRRELSRRAARSEELDAVLAGVQLGAPAQDAIAALGARLELLDTLDRRRRILRDGAAQLRNMATAGGAANAAALAERVLALEADLRTAAWMRQGLQDRIAELAEGGRERPEEPDTRPSATPAGGTTR
jgi:hypothetical protein